ncbi:hypothetical protein KUCAC02_034456 [Chaenocephalus aceratus]|nr:hypothetical protein KUCAC02_034456 [Chaenocephalus aceratus]
MRKSSRGASRTQRRRRSQIPDSSTRPSSHTAARRRRQYRPLVAALKQQRLAVPDPSEPRPLGEGITASSAARKSSHRRALLTPSPLWCLARVPGLRRRKRPGSRARRRKAPAKEQGFSGSADFRVLSERLAEVPCSCVWKESGNAAAESPCRCRIRLKTWQGVEVIPSRAPKRHV